jgi:hypothetical protein
LERPCIVHIQLVETGLLQTAFHCVNGIEVDR